MQKFEDAVERLKRIQKREAEKAKAEGKASNITPIKRRMIESSVLIRGQWPDEFLYQHTLFCQTVLPFRDPGPEVRRWERSQGNVRLYINAGEIYDRRTDTAKQVGLPFGTAARLLLCHLNTEALRRGTPIIEIEGSMTAFIHRLQGRAPTGPEIRKFKDQLTRLSSALVRVVYIRDEDVVQINAPIITGFNLWKDKNEGEQLIFPSTIYLAPEYFASLQEHAVPLDERAICALAHSAMALDVYCWMAQRLHRVDPKRGQFIAWQNLYEQFGQGYTRIRAFRGAFLEVLKLVHAQYPAAVFRTDKGGMLLWNSPPPVQRRAVLVGAPQPQPAPPIAMPNADMLALPAPKKPKA